MKALQQPLFYILFISVFILLSLLNNSQKKIDISANLHNSIGEKSQLLLSQINGNIHFTAYANNHPLIRQRIQQWFNRYQRVKADMTLEWINPETSPSITRDLAITVNGTVIIEHNKQQKRLEKINETTLTNALYQLINQQQKDLIFLRGHGERNPQGIANHDWLDFTKKLQQKGINSQTRNLTNQAQLNPKLEILVIASPLTQLLAQETMLIKQFIKAGGNALLVIDPSKKQPLQSLLQQLQVAILPGTIVDATTQNLGIDQVDFAIVSHYTAHPITKNFSNLSLYPQAAALDILVEFDVRKHTWDVYPFLSTKQNSWTETSAIAGDIAFNANTQERAGPLDIGLLLTRQNFNSQQEQRIVVMGDGDFVANAYLGNGGNLAIGSKIIHWLSSNDEQLQIENTLPKDLEFELSDGYRAFIGLGFLIGLPLLLLLIGFIINKKRHNR